MLALERDRGRDVDEQLHPQDLDGQERLAEPGDGRDEDEPEQRDVGRDQEDEALLDVVDDPAALAQPVEQRRERVVAEDEVRRLLGDRGPGAHRHRDIRASERRSVVDAVAGDGDRPAGSRGRARTSRSFWSGVDRATTRSRGSSVARAGRRPTPQISSPTTMCSGVEPGLPGDRRRGQRMVARHDDRLDPGLARRLERLADPVAERVGEPDEGLAVPRAASSTPDRDRPTSRSPLAALAVSERRASAGGRSRREPGEREDASGAPIAHGRVDTVAPRDRRSCTADRR